MSSYSVGVSLFGRRIELFGFEPEPGIRLERRDPNQDCFDYDKTRPVFRLTA